MHRIAIHPAFSLKKATVVPKRHSLSLGYQKKKLVQPKTIIFIIPTLIPLFFLPLLPFAQRARVRPAA